MAAASHDLTAVSPFSVPMPPYPFGAGGFYSVPFFFDFAKLKASQAWTIDPANADILFITTIPIGCQIHGVLMNVFGAATDSGTITVSVGDYSSIANQTAINAAGYMAATSIKATGYTGTIVTDAYGAATKVYGAAEYLALTFGGNATECKTGKIWIVVKASFITFPPVDPVSGEYIDSPSAWH